MLTLLEILIWVWILINTAYDASSGTVAYKWHGGPGGQGLSYWKYLLNIVFIPKPNKWL
jgi:hypothetical protein